MIRSTTPFRRSGRLFAAALIAVLAPAGFASAQDTIKPATDETTAYEPKALAVLARHVEAVGGEEAIKKLRHRTLVGEMEIPQAGLRGPLTVMTSAPNRFLMVLQFDGIGEMKQGFDGKTAWSLDPMQGGMVMDGAQFEQLRRQADFYAELNHQKNYKSIRYVGETTFNDVKCHELRLTDKLGKDSTHYYNMETNLFAGMQSDTESPMGAITQTTRVLEYKEFDGVRVATLVQVQAMQMEQRVTIKTVSHDPVADSTYELPAQIKAMLPEDAKDEAEPKEPARN